LRSRVSDVAARGPNTPNRVSDAEGQAISSPPSPKRVTSAPGVAGIHQPAANVLGQEPSPSHVKGAAVQVGTGSDGDWMGRRGRRRHGGWHNQKEVTRYTQDFWGNRIRERWREPKTGCLDVVLGLFGLWLLWIMFSLVRGCG